MLDIAALVRQPSLLSGSAGIARPFDGIISGFAALNTQSDLAPFATTAARLLVTDGRLIVHLLNAFSVWEWIGLAGRGHWRTAAQLGRRIDRTFVIGGQPVEHYLYRPYAAYRDFFARHFRLEQAYSIGALHPPANFDWLPTHLQRLLSRLERLCCTSRPFLNWGRFFVLDMSRAP